MTSMRYEYYHSRISFLADLIFKDEADLAQIKGMNVSAAAMILRHVDFNTFIDMTPGNRIEMFSVMVGLQRIVSLIFCTGKP